MDIFLKRAMNCNSEMSKLKYDQDHFFTFDYFKERISDLRKNKPSKWEARITFLEYVIDKQRTLNDRYYSDFAFEKVKDHITSLLKKN